MHLQALIEKESQCGGDLEPAMPRSSQRLHPSKVLVETRVKIETKQVEHDLTLLGNFIQGMEYFDLGGIQLVHIVDKIVGGNQCVSTDR